MILILYMVIFGCLWLMTVSTLVLHMLGFNWLVSIIVSFIAVMIVANKCDKEFLKIKNNKEG